jgi:hypothetical protein
MMTYDFYDPIACPERSEWVVRKKFKLFAFPIPEVRILKTGIFRLQIEDWRLIKLFPHQISPLTFHLPLPQMQDQVE